jgi:hypothetical protein
MLIFGIFFIERMLSSFSHFVKFYFFSILNILCMFWITIFIRHISWIYFLLSCDFYLLFWKCLPHNLILIESSLSVNFFPGSFLDGKTCKNCYQIQGHLEFCPMLSSWNFVFLHFSFMTMTSFELVFVKGESFVSTFIFLCLWMFTCFYIIGLTDCSFCFTLFLCPVKSELTVFLWFYF